jgi:hypothetical protein
MSKALFHVTLLHSEHDRTTFNSASEPLNRYLRAQISHDIKRRVATCFVALYNQRIAGYYTLACASIMLSDLPSNVGKKLPCYPTVASVRLGRLAVDEALKG